MSTAQSRRAIVVYHNGQEDYILITVLSTLYPCVLFISCLTGNVGKCVLSCQIRSNRECLKDRERGFCACLCLTPRATRFQYDCMKAQGRGLASLVSISFCISVFTLAEFLPASYVESIGCAISVSFNKVTSVANSK